MTKCVFCAILSGLEPASFVYQDEHLAVFLDIQPINPGHMLVVPRQHAVRLGELDMTAAGRLLQTAQQAAGALYQSGLRCEGVNLFLADGAAAGQDVFHVHLHVFPRWEGDGFGFKYGKNNFLFPERSVLDEIALQLRKHLDP